MPRSRCSSRFGPDGWADRGRRRRGHPARVRCQRAGVAEQADAADLKSAAREGFRVRVPAPAPIISSALVYAPRVIRRLRLILFLLMATLALTACGLVAPEQPAGAARCAIKERLNARLHVDSNDARAIWATDIGTNAPIALRIPAGYGVLHEDGDEAIVGLTDVIGRSGDLIVSGCRDTIQNAFMIDESDIRPQP
jgi:hypothetical protein